jgi:protein SCO1/2
MWSTRHPPRAAACRLTLSAMLALATPAAVHAVEIGGPFELVDQHGVTRTDADFRGSYLLVYFGYTYCPDLCPTTLIEMEEALERLAVTDPRKAARVVPMLVTVDPARDTPDVLAAYAEGFHPRLVALTGTKKALDRMGRKYGVVYGRALGRGPDDYLVDHTSFVYLMGPDGKHLEHFEKDASVDDLVAALERQVVVPGGQGS